VRVRGGSLGGKASAKREPKSGDFEIEFASDINGLSLAKNKLGFRADGYLRSEGRLELDDEKLRLSPLRAKLQNIELDTGRGNTSGDWLTVSRADLSFDKETSRARLEARGQISSLRFLLAPVRPGEDVFERIPNEGLGTAAVDYAFDLSRSNTGTSIDVTKFEGGPVKALAAISMAGEALRVAVYLYTGRIGIVSTGDDSKKIDVAVGPDWFEPKRAWVHGD